MSFGFPRAPRQTAPGPRRRRLAHVMLMCSQPLDKSAICTLDAHASVWCMCIYIYIYIHICRYTLNTYTCVYTCIDSLPYIYICVRLYIPITVYIIYIYIHIYRVYANPCIIYIRMYNCCLQTVRLLATLISPPSDAMIGWQGIYQPVYLNSQPHSYLQIRVVGCQPMYLSSWAPKPKYYLVLQDCSLSAYVPKPLSPKVTFAN